jgi:phospholipid/cholesterol/gamma-HCH transport system substrate-binding protein
MRYRNETIVGFVVVSSIVLLVFGAYWLAGAEWGTEQRELVAAFREAGDISEGNPVNYRGVQVGRISRIALSERGDGVYVTMNVRTDVELPADAGVVLSPVSLFGDWQAQIVSIANMPELEFTTTTVPDILPGSTLPDISQLTAVAARIAGDIEVLTRRVDLAFTEETAVKIRQTVDNVEEITAQLTGFVDQQGRVFADVSQNILTASERVSGATETVERMAQQVDATIERGDIDAILANAREASEGLRALSDELTVTVGGVQGMMARADTTMVAFGETASEVRVALREMQPQFAEIGPTLAQARETMATIELEIGPTMLQAREAMATLERVARRLEEGEGSLGRMIDDPTLYEETQAAIATLRRLLTDLQADPGRYIRNIRIF